MEGETSCLEPQGASVKAAALAFGGADSCLQTLSFRSEPAGTRLEACSSSPRRYGDVLPSLTASTPLSGFIAAHTSPPGV